ncbi:hypothetical protein Leryth_012378 [Lithospermum erythrorhizon]|nr:hypothetical protein Leryth_012378 [Lithospermum erythrorhizon]
MITNNKLPLILILSCLVATAMSAGEASKLKPGENLFARLEGEGGGGMSVCWNALMELKSCTNEIILFFLNGESYMGMDCCKAIRVITHECWPSMLTSLGYTSEEGDILSDYCGGAQTSPLAAPPLVRKIRV